ncbi:MAG TPA: type II toxin-antitoxin system prevent-host-death family antitoxin [Candidatus Rubrimentiphilum sp.]|nr:type II toxin-antitoxin system prevent-host-death family antitoxin [Candidatus Rubrimentiphilum sp.]
MKRANIHDAKTRFSALIHDVERGEEVVIAKAGVPVARLVPIERTGKKRELGYDKGLPFRLAADFDTFVPDEFSEYVE